jgi:hypothetical protein
MLGVNPLTSIVKLPHVFILKERQVWSEEDS